MTATWSPLAKPTASAKSLGFISRTANPDETAMTPGRPVPWPLINLTDSLTNDIYFVTNQFQPYFQHATT